MVDGTGDGTCTACADSQRSSEEAGGAQGAGRAHSGTADPRRPMGYPRPVHISFIPSGTSKVVFNSLCSSLSELHEVFRTSTAPAVLRTTNKIPVNVHEQPSIRVLIWLSFSHSQHAFPFTYTGKISSNLISISIWHSSNEAKLNTLFYVPG